MGERLNTTPVDPAAARAAIAACWFGVVGGSPAGGPPAEQSIAGQVDAERSQLGRVSLRAHQMDAVRELRLICRDSGGALLADEVGLGKTFVALALAGESRRPLVIAPAGLRAMWTHAAQEAGVPITLWSTECLSRAVLEPSGESHDLVIVDEAHHFRNPVTRRYRALKRITARSRVLLLTATPVHNRDHDLVALLALFLGGRAATLSDAERSRYIVRRGHGLLRAGEPAGSLRVPTITGPIRLALPDDDATLQAIGALPAPVPARDAGAAGALVAFGLLRQWASSAGALRAALRRRVARAVALATGLAAGRYPSYREVRGWCIGEGAVQLAFPELLGDEAADCTMLLEAVRHHEAAVRALLAQMATAADPDVLRAERIREVVGSHAGLRVVAFSAYEDTVRALYRQLRSRVRVCALSASGALIATGRLSRVEAIRQFAASTGPRAGGWAASDLARIDLLLTTDLLSEGVNLQEAAVVIHLDLPWTPARLAQRVGRVARLGSRHERVFVYALAPPASAGAVLGIERRLRSKLEIAGRVVGVVGSILPPLVGGTDSSADARTGPPEHAALARSLVRGWLVGEPDAVSGSGEATVCAAVRADMNGFLGACVADGRPVLVASMAGRGVTDASDTVASAVRSAEGQAVAVDSQACRSALVAIAEWWGQRRAAEDAGLRAVGSQERRRVLSRIASIARRSPPHVRPRLVSLIARARVAATLPCGVGAEWVLGELANASLPDVAWLRAVSAFGDTYGGRPERRAESGGGITVTAVILLVGPAMPLIEGAGPPGNSSSRSCW